MLRDSACSKGLTRPIFPRLCSSLTYAVTTSECTEADIKLCLVGLRSLVLLKPMLNPFSKPCRIK